MFEEITVGAAGMLLFLFVIMIGLITVWSWMLFGRGGKISKTHTRDLMYRDYPMVFNRKGREPKRSNSARYTIFHALFDAMEEEEKERH